MAEQCDMVCFVMNLKLDGLLNVVTYVVGFVLLVLYAYLFIIMLPAYVLPALCAAEFVPAGNDEENIGPCF